MPTSEKPSLAARLVLGSIVVSVTALHGAAQSSSTANAATWWEMGFRDRNWVLATRHLEQLPKRDRAPAHTLLLDCVHGEVSRARDADAQDERRALKRDNSVAAHFPFEGGWGSNALTPDKPQALRWMDWLLRAAPSGKADDAAHAVLAHLRKPGIRGPDCHSTEAAWWTALDDAVTDILSVAAEQRGEVFEVLAALPDSSWAVQEKSTLPERFEGRLVLRQGKRYKLRRRITIPPQAELWVERGAEIRLSSQNLPLDSRSNLSGGAPGPSFILCMGNIRLFGNSAEPARLVMQQVPKKHPDPVNAIRFGASFQALRGMEIQFRSSASMCIGIRAVTSLWLGDCRFIAANATNQKHTGTYCGGPNPPTSFYFESCHFEGLGVGLQHDRSSAWATHNSFAKNKRAVSFGGMNLLLFLSHGEFRGNDFDIYDATRYGGRIRMRDCNLTAQVRLSEDPRKEYDLSGNWWRGGRHNQILNFEEGRVIHPKHATAAPGLRAILGTPRKKRVLHTERN